SQLGSAGNVPVEPRIAPEEEIVERPCRVGERADVAGKTGHIIRAPGHEPRRAIGEIDHAADIAPSRDRGNRSNRLANWYRRLRVGRHEIRLHRTLVDVDRIDHEQSAIAVPELWWCRVVLGRDTP